VPASSIAIAQILGKVRLELSDLGAGAEPAGLHGGHNFIYLRLLDTRRSENQKIIFRTNGHVRISPVKGYGARFIR